jgi:hypothetical protein
MASERLRRRAPDRRGPVRNSVLRGPDRFRDPMDDGMQPTGESPRAYPGTVQGAVEKTVAAAYALSDQLMQRGYSAASHYSRPFGDPTMSDHRHRGPPSSYPPPPGGRAGPEGGSGPWDPRGPMGLWMEPWLQMMRLWTDSLYALSSSGGPMASRGAAGGGRGNPAMSVQVQSARPARVTMDLAPGSDFEELTVNPLRLSGGPDAETLDGVSLSSRPGQYTIDVKVSDEQAPGAYVGTVENRWRRPLGELRIEIEGDATAKPKKTGSRAGKKSGSGAAKKGGSKK